jgi:hypothetical protein
LDEAIAVQEEIIRAETDHLLFMRSRQLHTTQSGCMTTGAA